MTGGMGQGVPAPGTGGMGHGVPAQGTDGATLTTEEEDVMIEGRLMRGEVSGEGQGHLVLEALVELEVVQEVRGTEAGQGHIVGRDPGPDLDQGHGASQGQDLGRGKFITNNSQIVEVLLPL